MMLSAQRASRTLGGFFRWWWWRIVTEGIAVGATAATRYTGHEGYITAPMPYSGTTTNSYLLHLTNAPNISCFRAHSMAAPCFRIPTGHYWPMATRESTLDIGLYRSVTYPLEEDSLDSFILQARMIGLLVNYYDFNFRNSQGL